MSDHVYQNDVTAWLLSCLQREHKVIRVDTTVLIIYTGGTIGMVNLGEGYVPQPGAFQQLLRGNIRPLRLLMTTKSSLGAIML